MATVRVCALGRLGELLRTAVAEAAVVVDCLVEQPTVVGGAVVDQQLHARYAVKFESSIHDAERAGGMAKNHSPKKTKSSPKTTAEKHLPYEQQHQSE